MSLAPSLKRLVKAVTPESVLRRWYDFHWPYRSLRWLPGSSLRYGPARRWVQIRDYLACHPGEYREVLPPQCLPAATFHCANPIPDRFFSRLQRDIPAAGVLRLREARLMGAAGWIIGAQDSFLIDASYHIRPDAGMSFAQHHMLRRRRALPLRRLPGRTLSLASDFARGGLAHFIHDSLCRLHLLELAGIDWTDFDHVYWPRLGGATVTTLVEAAGIPRGKLVDADDHHDLWCEELTATTFPGLPAHLTPPYLDFLRRRFAPPPQGSHRRVYLARSGFRRNFRNAAEVETVLREHGYEICVPHTDPDVLAKCAAASHLVSLEGSNFFNAFAAPPGTRALIIIPSAGQTLPYTLTLAYYGGFDTRLLLAASLPDDSTDATAADLHIDPDLLAVTLNRMDRPKA